MLPAVEHEELRRLIQDALSDRERYYAALKDRVDVLVWPIVNKSVYDADARQDVIQEIQIAVSQQLSGISRRDDPRVFIMAIARNKCLHHRRHQVTGSRRVLHVSSEVVLATEKTINAQDFVEQAEDYGALEEFIATLPPMRRAILDLRFKHEQSLMKIGEEVGLSQRELARLLTEIFEAARRWFEQGGREAARPDYA